MRHFSKLLFLFVLLAGAARAQTFFGSGEYGIFAGGSQYFGDLNDKYGFQFVRPAGGAFARLHLNPFIALRVNLGYTKIGYDDKFSSNEFNRRRNLNFRSDIYEFSVQSEFNFTRFMTGDFLHRFTPYLTGGIGVFYYNPYTTFNDRRYNLRNIGTEGQNTGMYDDRKYSHFSLCFPVGVGVKWWIRPGLNLGFEIANRLTLTDYMDDVSNSYVGDQYFPNDDPLTPNPGFYLQDRSGQDGTVKLGREGKQRGNSSTKDQYMFFVINLSFQLKVYKCPSYMERAILE